MHFCIQIIVLVTLNGAVHLDLAWVLLLMSVSRNSASSGFVMHFVRLTTVLVACGLAFMNLTSAMVLVVLGTINYFGVLKFLGITFDSCFGFVAVDFATRSLVVNFSTLLESVVSLRSLFMLVMLELFLNLVHLFHFGFVLFSSLDFSALLVQVGVHSLATLVHGRLFRSATVLGFKSLMSTVHHSARSVMHGFVSMMLFMLGRFVMYFTAFFELQNH